MSNYEINRRIASVRKLREYKQSDVAEFLGLKTSTYSQMERKGNITGEMIIKIAKIFEVDPMYIFCGEEKNDIPNQKQESETIAKNLTNLESNIIKIFRNLNKEKQESICDFVSQKAGLGKYKDIKRKK